MDLQIFFRAKWLQYFIFIFIFDCTLLFLLRCGFFFLTMPTKLCPPLPYLYCF